MHMDDKEENGEMHLNNDTLRRVYGRTGRVIQTVDVAEVMQRRTQALQPIYKQSPHLV